MPAPHPVGKWEGEERMGPTQVGSSLRTRLPAGPLLCLVWSPCNRDVVGGEVRGVGMRVRGPSLPPPDRYLCPSCGEATGRAGISHSGSAPGGRVTPQPQFQPGSDRDPTGVPGAAEAASRPSSSPLQRRGHHLDCAEAVDIARCPTVAGHGHWGHRHIPPGLLTPAAAPSHRPAQMCSVNHTRGEDPK